MTIEELKRKIVSKSLNDSLLILRYSDYQIIPDEYIKEISNYKKLTITYINSLSEVPNNDFSIIETSSDNLYVLKVDKFSNEEYSVSIEELIAKLYSSSNLIIVCKEAIDDLDSFIVDIPKLKDEFLIEYGEAVCEGLGESEINWVVTKLKNPYLIMNEFSKIKLFSSQFQEDIFNSLESENNFKFQEFTIYEIANAILFRDYKIVVSYLNNLNSYNYDSLALVSILYKNVKNIINIQMNPKATPENCVLTDKQFWYIKKNNCNIYTNNQLIDLFIFLTGYEIDLKTGKLSRGNIDLIKYIVYNIFNILS